MNGSFIPDSFDIPRARPMPGVLETALSTTSASHVARKNSDRRDTPNPIAHEHHSVPRAEPWLLVVLSSFVPTFAALALTGALRFALLAAAGALFIAGAVMLVRQEAAK